MEHFWMEWRLVFDVGVFWLDDLEIVLEWIAINGLGTYSSVAPE